MLQTKRQLVQECLYEAYGGITSSDVRISERFVLTKINNKIAASALPNAFQSSNLEGVTYADDIFYITFTEIDVQDDPISGYKYFPLPAQPIGLPRQRSFSIYPSYTGDCTGLDSTLFKMVPMQSIQQIRSLPVINKVFCFVQDGKMMLMMPKAMPLLKIDRLNLVIASADGGMDSTLNMPQDMIDAMKKGVVAELRAIILGVPQDLKNDGVEITEPRV